MIKEHNGSTWQGKSYSKIVDTTQQVTSFPVVVRPMDDIIPSWIIKGNMSQTGTPTPSSPIQPSECGERTENLFDKTTAVLGERVYVDKVAADAGWAHSDYIDIDGLSYITVSKRAGITTFYFYENKTASCTSYYQGDTAEVPEGAKYVRINMAVDDVDSNMLVSGSTAPSSFIPYGYKIPISSANATTPVYLGEVQTERKIKKYEFTGQEEGILFNETYSRFQVFLPNSKSEGVRLTPAYSSHYQVIDDGRAVGDVPNESLYSDVENSTRWFIKITDYTTVQDFKAYLAQQYAAGTPVTVWYVLATEETAVVNEPIRKIGTYSDSVSGTNLSVTAQSPTTIDVDTSLKPSEMDLTYAGLKMCGRKKYAHGNSPQILPSAKAGSRTSGNVTLTCDGNGVYTLVGSPTPNTLLTFDIPPTEIPLSVGGGGNGTLSLFNDSVYNNFDIIFIYQGTQYRESVSYSPNTINKTSTTYGSNSSDIGGKTIISIGVHFTGYGNINCTFSPMITNDGQLPSTFQPYCSWQ